MKILTKVDSASNIHFLNQRILLLKLACLVIALPSLLALGGWLMQHKALEWLLPDQVTMKANAALAFILASVALYLFHKTGLWVYLLQRLIALSLFLLGVLTLYYYLTQTAQPYIDELWLQSRLLSASVYQRYILAYRMSPLAAINIMLVALCIFFLANRYSNRQLNTARLFVIPVIISSILVLIGYAYGVRDLYHFGALEPLSPMSAISFVLLSTSLLCIRAERGFMRLFVGKTLGSRMARWLIPALIMVFSGIGWLCRQGNLLQLYNNQFETALLIFLTLFLSSALIIWQARMQHGQELLRQHAQHALLMHNLELEQKIRQRTQQLEILMRELEAQSLTDSLTGIANRRAFEQRLILEWQRAVRYQHALSLIILDIDYFKRLNDDFGHQTGDDILKEVALLLTLAIRETDLVCRYGGEEFIVIMMETEKHAAIHVAERLRLAIADHPWPIREITASLGVATLKADQTTKALLKEADCALYQAKAAGRNRVISFEA